MNRFEGFSKEELAFLHGALQVPSLSLTEEQKDLKDSLQTEMGSLESSFRGGGPIGYGVRIPGLISGSYQL